MRLIRNNLTEVNEIHSQGIMKTTTNNIALSVLIALLTSSAGTVASNRYFGYVYQPETSPAGELEFEQWVTVRSGRTSDTVNPRDAKENYTKMQVRSEIEYGVTDRYTVSGYLNFEQTRYREVFSGSDISKFRFAGVSIENRYMVLNPAENPVGMTLYIEPTFAGDESKLEEKIIFGNRFGDWIWAVNFIHETEWKKNFNATDAKVAVTAGLARSLGKHWTLGVEAREVTGFPEYEKATYSALFLGPVLSYRNEKLWGLISVMPQIYGTNYGNDTDNNPHLVLTDLERVNIRVGFGFEF